MEGSSVRSMGVWRGCTRDMGLQAGKEDCRARPPHRPHLTDHADPHLRILDSMLLQNSNRGLEILNLRTLHDPLPDLCAEGRQRVDGRNCPYEYISQQDLRWEEGWKC